MQDCAQRWKTTGIRRRTLQRQILDLRASLLVIHHDTCKMAEVALHLGIIIRIMAASGGRVCIGEGRGGGWVGRKGLNFPSVEKKRNVNDV